MSKKRIIIGCLVFLFTIIVILLQLFFKWANEPMNPEVPEKSEKGKVILASRGCCYWAEDVTVYMLDENGNNTTLISAETVYEYDIFECTTIPKNNAPIKVGIDFLSFYPDAKPVSLIVGYFSSTDEMLKNGLLLRFGDGDLMVYNGNNKAFFRDGVFHKGDSDEWYQDE